ncbi:dipeptidase. Metallo peptidase. MEROPS family M19 [Thermosyntropha lipolytica DSM 11003]|uniref:Dipeptidase. Metallo peptidase. MEROPS family M19 n=1 Tax=Thermosyntropha lipolytica DSM 11003 TaxID=1123382 RepID=A0A1M5QGQ6_9FIRM|nr:dipeptidase [Thermosyntropha lipolytica]SHH12693.1 dipeptidase. Metallo peptidase. MEROPS family M19 [Thermosyntropha lipolytica DSM 11003]
MKIIDLHCDTISLFLALKGGKLIANEGHFDLRRALQAGVGLQFFSLFSPPDDSGVVLRRVLKQLELFYKEMESNKDILYLVQNYKDIETNINKADKIGGVLHLEGAEALGLDIDILHLLYRLGLRSLGLTWNKRNFLADGVEEGEGDGGLSRWGRQVVKEANKLGIIIDLSHIGEKSFYDVLEATDKPVMVTHANAYAVCPHRRNLKDVQLKALSQNKGIVGITQVSDFVKEGKPEVDDLLFHIVYIADLIGCEYIALGSDFDGASDIVMSGIEDYANWENLLRKKGFCPKEIEDILQNNALRVMREILK